jgi:serine protease Do
MRRPFASHRLRLGWTASRPLMALAIVAIMIGGLGLATRSGSWFARWGFFTRSSPATSGFARLDSSNRLTRDGAANVEEPSDPSVDHTTRSASENLASHVGTIAGHAPADGRLGAAESGNSKAAVIDSGQGDAALFAAWERLERRVAAAMVRARESVVALEYTPAGAPAGRRRLATGVVINHRGEILSVRIDRPAVGTSSSDAAAIVARDATGRRHAARWVASDPQTGLTLLRVASRAMKPIRTAGDEPELGSQLFVMGNPFGMGHSVSRGYVAGLERTLEIGSSQLGGLIQIQTPLYPGDSGAAVVNIRGEWLGMIRSGLAAPGSGGDWTEAGQAHASSTHSVATVPAPSSSEDESVSSRADQDNGFGFAIPARDALWVADQLRGGGRVDRAYLGVRLDMGWNLGLSPAPSAEPEPKSEDASSSPATATWSNPRPAAVRSSAAASDGAVLQEVLPNTPAASGGLRPGDLIISLDGLPIHSALELTDRLDRIPARTTIQVGIMRTTGASTERIDLSLCTVSRPGTTLASAASRPLSVTGAPSVPVTPTAARTPAPDRRSRPQADSVQPARAGSIAVPASNELSFGSRVPKPVVGDRPEPATPARAPNASVSPSVTDIRLALPRAVMERLEQLERRLEKLEHIPARNHSTERFAEEAARSGQVSSPRPGEAAGTPADLIAEPRPRP